MQIDSGAVVNGGIVEVGNGIVDIAAPAAKTSASCPPAAAALEIADMPATRPHTRAKSPDLAARPCRHHGQYIDLADVTSGGGISLSYASGSNTSGTLTVSSGGTLVATIDLIGTYSSGNFHITSGAGGTVEITDPAVVNGGEVHSANIALFGSYIASFAGGGHGGLVITSTGQIDQPPLLVHPHA